MNHVLPVVPVWQPVSLPVGGLDRERVEARAAALGLMALRWPEQWPPDTRAALLAGVFAQASGRAVAYSLAAFRQAYAAGRDLGVTDNVLVAAAACELHPRAMLKGMESRSVARRLAEAQAEADAAGVRVSPTLRLGDRLWEGEESVEEAAEGIAAAGSKVSARTGAPTPKVLDMASDVMMPRLSDSMEEGTVLKWLVEQGAEVKRGEPLAEIETDKANMTYEADQEGTLIEIVAGEGDTVAIGEVIARLGEPGEASSGDGGESDGGGAEQAEAEGADDAEASAETEEAADQEEGAEGEASADTQGTSQSDEAEGGGEVEAAGDAEAVRGEAGSSDGEGNGRAKASPVARRMAEQKGVDLSALEGSGPGGRIVKADVEAAAGNGGAPEAGGGASAEAGGDEAAAGQQTEDSDGAVEQEETHAPVAPPSEKPSSGEAGAKGGVETVDLSRLQKTVARRMSESKATAPDFQIAVEVDMEACIALRTQLREFSEKAPSYNDMVVKACAMALRDFPRANGAYRDGTFELYDRVNVGIAVSAMDALVVPTIFDADKKSLGEISRDSRGLAAKVRDGNIAPPELSGGTFTVSNLGMFGIDDMIPVINPPQAAILGVGAMRPRAVVGSDGRIVARNTMFIRLSTDHRILYGADAAEFLSRIRELLETPMMMAL